MKSEILSDHAAPVRRRRASARGHAEQPAEAPPPDELGQAGGNLEGEPERPARLRRDAV
jgi:hypothetical protein